MQNDIYQPPKTEASAIEDLGTLISVNSEDLVEFQRLKDKQAFEELAAILKDAGIKFKVGSNAPIFDISTIGMERDVDVIVSVLSEDFKPAQEAAEAYYLKSDLPKGHYLLSSSNEELTDVIASPKAWSPFDVAHAKSLAKQRNIDLELANHRPFESINEQLEERPLFRILLLAIFLLCTVCFLIAWASHKLSE